MMAPIARSVSEVVGAPGHLSLKARVGLPEAGVSGQGPCSAGALAAVAVGM